MSRITLLYLSVLNKPTMKKHLPFAVAMLLTITVLSANSQDYHVRIGFIGNSITFGVTLTNPKTECYPAQLGHMLQEKYGDTCILGNFAITTRTMLKHGDFPIWNDVEFRDAWKFAPEILLICLGTNDSKPQNWDLYGHEFYDDYKSMIDTFRIRNPHVQFLVCHPAPAYREVWGIRDSVIRNGVIPAIDSILDYSGATLVDFYTPLIDSVSLFPDYIHPNFRGSGALARIVYNTMMDSDIIHKVDTGSTFVTDLETDTRALAIGDSATLTWTTVNADSAFLNAQPVPGSGSCKVSPVETMVYRLTAMGKTSVDSMSLEQMVYQPVLTRLMISPRSTKVYEGDTVNLKVTFIDQMNKPLPESGYTVFWSVLEGDGSLINETANMADFVAGSAGKAVVEASVDTLYIKSTITIQSLETGTGPVPGNRELTVFPNPAGNLLYIELESNGLSALQIQLFDLDGTRVLDENPSLPSAGIQTISVKIKDLHPGTYLYKIDYAGTLFTGKVVVYK
jgi:acyl-CoA thioesterase-1